MTEQTELTKLLQQVNEPLRLSTRQIRLLAKACLKMLEEEDDDFDEYNIMHLFLKYNWQLREAVVIMKPDSLNEFSKSIS